ncbi:non-ribosomal peptide synthetase [Brevibacillus dissolubilis]|uniref:non-ribosomal peptide synthetase n=1 Tax=Brevibacillus dissolubilis TaxID=1844116 RepID=UPI00111779B6|nr:non-ribosomal peptide synthetase [Brevibacillus dissolubilis]
MTYTTLIQLLSSYHQQADHTLGLTIVKKSQERFISYAQLYTRSLAMLAHLQAKGMQPKDQLVLQLEDHEEFLYMFWAAILGGMIPVPVTVGSNEQRNKLIKIWEVLESPYLTITQSEWNGILAFYEKQEQHDVQETLAEMERKLFIVDELVPSVTRSEVEGTATSNASTFPTPYDADPHDIAFIQFSSGSTGDPKGVMLTHDNLLTNLRAIIAGAGTDGNDSTLSWMPLTHDMGLIGFHLTPLMARFPQFLMAPSVFVTQPMIWMQKVNQHRITITSSPNFGYQHFARYFKPEKAVDWDLSCIRLIFNGAEPISTSVCHSFLKLLEPYGVKQTAMYPVYGMAEACLGVTFPPVEETLRYIEIDRTQVLVGEPIKMSQPGEIGSISLVDVGYPVQDCEMRICGEHDEVLEEGFVGRIQIRGRNVTSGYYRRPDVTKATIDAEGWLDTGDIGVVVHGRLHVVGRRKEIIFVNGQNIYPYDLERLAEEVDGVEAGKTAVCGIPDAESATDEIWAFIQFRGSIEKFVPLMRTIGQHIHRQSGLEVKRILPIKHIPKTTSGKIQRYKLVERFHQGEFAQVIEEIEQELVAQGIGRVGNADGVEHVSAEARSTTHVWDDTSSQRGYQSTHTATTETEQRIYQIWREILDSTAIGLDDHFLELGGNSLKAMMVISRIEDDFGLKLPLHTIFEYATIRKLATYVEHANRVEHQEIAAVSLLERQWEKDQEQREQDVYPASSGQKRLYVLQEMNPDHVTYNLPQAMLVEGQLDPAHFQQVWNQLIQRHESFRTSFEMIDGQLVQRCHESIDVTVLYRDEAEAESGVDEQKLQKKVQAFIQPFNLQTAPLFRAELIRVAEDRHLFLFDMHHIISDGTSMGILIQDFVRLYQGESLEPLHLQHKDFVEWQRIQRANAHLEPSYSFWQETFADGIPVLQLPTDYLRPTNQSFQGDRLETFVDAELASGLKRIAKEQQCTLYSVLLSAYHVLLSRYSGQKETVVGTAVAGRTLRKSEKVVGLFVNSLPILIQSGESKTFAELLQKVKTGLYSALEHQDVPFEDMLDLLKVRREPGRNPLFDTMFTLQNMELPTMNTETLTFVPYPVENHTAKFDLTWECYEAGQELKLMVEYAEDLFHRNTVERMVGHYVHILQQIVSQSDMAVEDIRLLTEPEKEQLEQYSSATSAFPKHMPLNRLFEQQVALTPDASALVMDGETLSYHELNARANQVARWLEEQGITSQSRVALLVDRSFEMIVSILAVLKAGAAYVPIDPQYPMERIQLLVEDAGAAAILTQKAYASLGSEIAGAVCFAGKGEEENPKLSIHVLDDILPDLTTYSTANLPTSPSASDTAYIMYTSGSTGKPKGILTTHTNVCRVVKETNYITITGEDALLQLSNYAFDGSTFDIYGALLNGAKLVLVNKETMLDMKKLSDLIQTERVSIFFTTTALFNTLVDVNVEALQSVRKILFGGERVSLAHVRKALQFMGPGRLMHVYGPTETTVFATAYEINQVDEKQHTIPIGRPISNTQLLVVDAAMKPVPVGIPGELCIAGEGVADGYLHLPELTNEKFVPHPQDPFKRMFKTGDLVRWLSDGNIEFLDRIDNQVKIRGYRIELGEIESKIMDVAGVLEAVVDVKQRGSERVLCAYFVASGTDAGDTDGGVGTIASLKAALHETLPYYMMPSYFVQLDTMPLTRNGKIDKKALPEPEWVTADAYVAPVGVTEQRLAQIWQELLQIGRVGREDHFLEVGGHSLKATSLTAQIHKEFDVRFAIGDIFRYPTIREQAMQIELAAKSTYEPIPPAEAFEADEATHGAIQEAAHGSQKLVQPKASQNVRTYPLTSAQQRMFVQAQFDGVGTTYNVPLLIKLEGNADLTAIQSAWQQLIRRHEPLRTSFGWQDGQVVQFIHEQVELSVDVVAYREGEHVQKPGQETEQDVQQDTQQVAQPEQSADLHSSFAAFVQPFDLTQAPLCRVQLVTTAAGPYMFVDLHHIIADGISMKVLLNDFISLYDQKTLSPLALQYKDYAVWYSRQATSPHMEEQLAYWKKQLAGPLPVLDMPTDHVRPQERQFTGDVVPFQIAPAYTDKLEQIAQKEGITLNSLLFAIYTITLHKYTGQHEFIIGSLTAGRSHPDILTMVGMFNNFLPIRTELPTAPITVIDYAKELHQTLLAAYEHQDVAYDRLVQAVPASAQTDLSRNLWFDTMLIVHNELDADLTIRGEHLQLIPQKVTQQSAKLDFKLDVYVSDSHEMLAELEYNTSLFQRGTMERFMHHFVHLMGQITDNPTESYQALSLIQPDEQAEILHQFNQTEQPYPTGLTLSEWFEQQVMATPDNPAAKFGAETLTYRQLNEKANQLARVLRNQGVGPDSIVAIMVERSLDMIIGIMGILKAGGAYLPIDPHHPQERIRYMLEDSRAVLICTHHKWVEQHSLTGEVVLLDDQVHHASQADSTNLLPIHTSRNLAYVIYTSGSTGKPKGTMIEHEAAINRIHWMQRAYPITGQDVILQKTPYTFDVSVWELFWWSTTGASVVFLEPGGEKDPQCILDTITQEKVTTMHFVPSMLHVFLQYLEQESGDTKALSSLRYVFTSGEALQVQHVRRFKALFTSPQHPDLKLVNLYGPTEATVDVSYYECTDTEIDHVPIGKPIDNIRLYVINENHQLQPIGVPGQLAISGVGLARGYLHNEPLTQEKFVADPFARGERMYLTGDLVRWAQDGNIQYLGRIDHQIKIRGVRMECGEIEFALQQHEAIQEVLVTAVKDHAGEQALVAYFTAVSTNEKSVGNTDTATNQISEGATDTATNQLSEADIDSAIDRLDLRNHLLRYLPEVMIPSFFVQLDQFPLSPNGKIDRKQLPAPDLIQSSSTEEHIAPRTETEQQLAHIWEELLGITSISVRDSFFLLGGHSLKATQLTGKIKERFAVHIPLKQIFAAPTIEQLAGLISETEPGQQQEQWTAIPQAAPQPYYPLSPAQNRLFILQQMEESQTTYNLPVAMRITGKLDIERLQQVLNALVQRHEPLRTSFVMVDGEPMQQIHDDVTLHLTAWTGTEEQVEALAETFIQPFDLRTAPLFRAGIIQLSEHPNTQPHPDQSDMERSSHIEPSGHGHILLLDMHHIVSDGISMVNLTREFIQLYQGLTVEPLPLQLKDIAVWQQNWLQSTELQQQEKYWLDQLKGELPLLNLPLDFPRPTSQQYDGSKSSYTLPADLTTQIKQFAEASGTTLYMTLLTAFYTMLYRYTNQDDIIVGLPVSGRTHPAMQPLVGMFVNTLAFRSHPTGDKTFRSYLEEVKEAAISAYEHQDYPFEKLVAQLDIPRDLSRNPLFDVMFVLQNMGLPELTLEEMQFTPYEMNHRASKVDITFEFVEQADTLQLNVEYRTKLLTPETISRMVAHYCQIIGQAVMQPQTPLAQIKMLTDGEERLIMHDFNATQADYEAHLTLDAVLERQAQQTPDHIAVSYEGESLTYRELDQKSNQLARLLRQKGVQSESLVAIMLDRSLEMIVCVMAILKAGGAYVPIAPHLPAERIGYLMQDSGSHWLLTQEKYLTTAAQLGAEVINLEDGSYNHEDVSTLPKVHDSRNRAYVIYTSGSTGQPKGVVIEHHSVINRIAWMQKMYPLTEQDVILQKTPFTFDVSVWELFWWSFTGARVIMLAPGGEKDPQQMIQTIAEQKVTTMHFVPSMLNLFLEYVEKGETRQQLATLKHVFTSGEALNLSQVDKFRQTIGAWHPTRLINLYGPTEATVDVSYYECVTDTDSGETVIPIGRPIDNIQLYIVNEQNQLQPIGIAGELCIAGVGLAREYLNRPELTAEKFIPNPFDPATNMYRTGDLARWLSDGNIEYLGRLDHQVKIRGYRIECGEIEHQLMLHPSVNEAVVIARKDQQQETYLCAYIVAGQELSVLELKAHLAKQLPDYMIPAHFMQLPALPLSTNGKVDRKQLPAPDHNLRTGVEFVAASNDTERFLAELWQELLGKKEIGIHDNFFDVGGNSLLILRAHQKLEERFPNQLKVADLFAYPTISKLAGHLDTLTTQQNRNVTLSHLPLPKGYFHASAEAARLGSNVASYQFQLDQAVYHQLKEMAQAENVLVSDICYSAYVYLWSQISQQAQLIAYSMTDEQAVQAMEIDLAPFNQLDQLFRYVNKQGESAGQEAYTWKELVNSTASQDAILPLYHARHLTGLTINPDWLQLFDVILTVEEQPSRIQCRWEYNGKRLNKEKMKETVQLYVKCIQLMVNQYSQQKKQ